MADGHRAATALGLQRFADVVDDIGVDHRQIAEHQVGRLQHVQAALLARLPFGRAVGAEMHQRIDAEAFAQPEVGRQVAVRWRHLGVVVERLFAVAGALATRRLRHDDLLAQLQPRNGESTGLGQVQSGLLRFAPALENWLAHVVGQVVEPGLVAFQRQARGAVVGQQFLQFAVAVEGRQQAAQFLDQPLLVGLLHVVAAFGIGAEQALQAARHVEEGGTEVLFAGRVVVELDDRLHFLVGQPLQARQAQGLVDHRLQLALDGDDVAVGLARGGGEQRVDQPGELRLRQVEGNVLRIEALGIGLPVRLLAAPVGHGLQHRDAEQLELGLASGAVEHDLHVDQRVGARLAGTAQQRGDLAVAHRRGVQRHGDGTGGLDAPQRIVDEAGQPRVHVGLVEQHADQRHFAAQLDALPGEEIVQAGEDSPVGLGMIDAGLRMDIRRGAGRAVFTGELRLEATEEAIEVGHAAVAVIQIQIGDQRIGHLPATAAVAAQPQPGRLHGIEQRPQAHLHGAQRGAIGRVDYQQIVGVQFGHARAAAGAIEHAVVEGETGGAGQRFQTLELARLHRRGSDEQQALRRLGLRLDAHRQAHHQQTAGEQHQRFAKQGEFTHQKLASTASQPVRPCST